MIPIAYYISGHGYGHAVRSRQVVLSLRDACPELKLHVRTTTPRRFFESSFLPVFYHKRSLDAGVSQRDSLEVDLEKTLGACQALHREIPQLISEEVDFIQREGIRLVIGDIPPLCFEIAAQCSLPSVAIANFTWDWIYRAYLTEFPAFLPLIRQMEDFYRKATLALSLPFACDLRGFPRMVPIPLITRASALDKAEARKQFGLPATAIIVLMSFGGFGLKQLPWEEMERCEDFFFVTTGELSSKGKNFLVLPEAQPQYHDLVRAADAVVSKPGYGIVADVIAHRVPILFTSRGPFPEYPFLVEALSEWATSAFVPQEELRRGKIGPHLKRLLEREPSWPTVPLNGAQVAAERIIALLGEG